jgi:hypothetical protein
LDRDEHQIKINFNVDTVRSAEAKLLAPALCNMRKHVANITKIATVKTVGTCIVQLIRILQLVLKKMALLRRLESGSTHASFTSSPFLTQCKISNRLPYNIHNTTLKSMRKERKMP